MKKILVLLLLTTLFILPCLNSCSTPPEEILIYDGPKIKSMEYITVDYNGGASKCNMLDFENGTVYEKRYVPSTEESAEYEVIYDIDLSKIELLINLMHTAGLFNLDESYTTDDIIYDGGGFRFIITYANGNQKVSWGSNAEPTEIFKKADEKFFDITGEEFFDRVDDSYKSPPKAYIQTRNHADFPHTGPSRWLNLSPYKYTWGKRSYEAVEFTAPTVELRLDGDDQLLMLSYSTKFIIKDVKIFTYKSSEAERQALRRENVGYDKNCYVAFELKPDTNYIVIFEYENGTAKYRFNTSSATK